MTRSTLPSRFALRRRGLLALAGGGLAGTILPAWMRLPTPDPLAQQLVSIFAHRHSAEQVGRAYLAWRREEADPLRLLAALRRDLRLGPASARSLSTAQFRRRVRQVSHQDLRAGRTFSLGGYGMPVTELRLCALAALIA